MKPSPTNTKLYNKIKQEAKQKFKVWPSAYASGWLVKEYKRRGGGYSGKKSKYSGISRWYNEKWINVCKLPKKVSCGRSKLSKNWKENYPYCRPSIRINSSTPKTAKELSKEEIKKRCQIKRKSPMKKVTRSKRVRSSPKKVTRSKRVRSSPKKVTRSKRLRSRSRG
jgi:hypothetical protein